MQFWRLSPSLKETIYVEVLNTVYKLSVGAIWCQLLSQFEGRELCQ